VSKQPNWNRKTLGEALPIRYGKARTDKAGIVRQDSPVYGSSGVIDRFDRALTSGPTLIIGRKGSVGTTHYSAEPCWPIDTVYFAEASDDKDLRFFKYLLDHLQLGRMDRSTAVPGLSRDDYNAKEVAIPEIDEQQQIVEEIEKQFTRLDAGVASLKRVQVALKRHRASVLKAACEGRLVDTEAELAHQENRSYETGEELLRRILKERREKWNGKGKYREPLTPLTSNLPTQPEGWAWATWDQIGLSQNGRPFHSAEYQPMGFKLLRPGNLHISGKVVWNDDNTRFMPQQRADRNSDLVVRGRELVMNLTAQSLKDEFLGRVCLTGEKEECLLNQRLARLTPIIVLPEFALYLLKAWRFRRFVDELNTGSLIQHMFTSQLAEFTFPLPPLAEQTRIVAEVERKLSVVEELEAIGSANLRRSARLRQSILHRTFKS
jgi:type I restriction enzyme, S subunit